MNLRALEAIAKLPLDIGPFTQSTTGATVPFFNDSRKVYSHPEIFAVFTGGSQKKSAVEFIRETAGDVTDVIVWINTLEVSAAGIDRGRRWIEEQNIRVHYFMSYLSLFEAYYKKGLISDALFEIIKDFIEHINDWQTAEEKWKRFEEVKADQRGQFI